MKSEDLYLKSLGIPEIYKGRTYKKDSEIKGKFTLGDKIVIKVVTQFEDNKPKVNDKGQYYTNKVVYLPVNQGDNKYIVITTSKFVYDVLKHMEYEETVVSEHKKFKTSTETIEGEFSFTEKPRPYGDKTYMNLDLVFE